jgi:hypothetical protein
MSALSNYLHAVAEKLRFWSSETYDLSTAGHLREIVTELHHKAEECREVECPSVDTNPDK